VDNLRADVILGLVFLKMYYSLHHIYTWRFS